MPCSALQRPPSSPLLGLWGVPVMFIGAHGEPARRHPIVTLHIPMARTMSDSVPQGLVPSVGPCVGSWLCECRSRVGRSGPLAPFVLTPSSQSHPETIPISLNGWSRSWLGRFFCANVNATSTPVWEEVTETLSGRGVSNLPKYLHIRLSREWHPMVRAV